MPPVPTPRTQYLLPRRYLALQELTRRSPSNQHPEPNTPMLLALDTATRQAGLALYDGDEVRAEATWNGGRHHTEWLAPAIEDALHRIHATAADLSAIAVTIGPGSFTGLRVALSLAKGLAVARNLPLLAVDTLDVTAYPHLERGTPLCTTLPAGRGRHVYAFYEASATRAALGATPPALATVAGVAHAVMGQVTEQGSLWVVGEFTPAERQHLHQYLPAQASLLSPALCVRRPAALAEMAWQRFAAEERDDLHALEPIYLNLPAGE